MRMKLLSLGMLFAACLIGCNSGAPTKDKPGDDPKKAEEQVKEAFKALQTAVKEKDADKIWNLLDKDSQADAEREAGAAKEVYGKLADKDKADYKKRLNLTDKELADLTGKLYVKSEVFYKKHHEIPDSKLEKLSVSGDTASLNFIEPDNDNVKMSLTRDKGQWKFSMKIPKAPEK
jgi:hypothetical protein